MDIGEKIKFYRTLKGITQKQLAELSGIHPVTIRKYEVGMLRPKPEQIQKLAVALDINTFMLLENLHHPLNFNNSENLKASIHFLLSIGVLLKDAEVDGECIMLHPIIEGWLKDNENMHNIDSKMNRKLR